ncbi:nuclear transport factor 2 family protein [Oceanicoccus sp. KOV_DT_Chl]|uniref:nuclear transport factor 2 family protein n=1 Tax=Oceanicoccus sp. KOV_DT_Chl TaxID=1904639 RepID=UPI000C7E7ED9|nr:nuclear transport factor 2 family protein [Oceanicoccus sp. KOV_DT_Chl]
MKVFLLLTTLLLSFSHGCFAAGDHEMPLSAKPIVEIRELSADEKTIQNLLNTYAQAMEQRSIKLAEQVVIPDDFSTIESGYPNWSWQDFRDNHLSKELDSFTDVTYTIQLLLGELNGELGFAIYKFTAAGVLKGKAGAADIPMSISGLATAILEQTSIADKPQWRIHHIHSSAPRQGSGAH